MTKRRLERFEILKIARRYDQKNNLFIFNIAYKTATQKASERTTAVAESFGLGFDKNQKFTIYDNMQLKISPSDIVYITGESGSGKSILLKAIEKDLKKSSEHTTINIADIKPQPRMPIIETVGKTTEEALELLSKVGLNDAFLFLRSYKQLSDGQKYRYKIAKMIESQAQFWFMDEFAATLDRDTAKIVAYNLQKLARQQAKAVIVATTHTDLLEDLKPSVHAHKRFGKEIAVSYYPNVPTENCTVARDVQIEEGTTEDWKKLSGFHYRSHTFGAPRKIFCLKKGEELCGVIIYSFPPLTCFGRAKVLPKMPLDELNKKLSTVSRVVVHPKYRSIGLGSLLLKKSLPLAGTPFVEMVAVMAKYNPFAEKAGMKKIAESKPSKHTLQALEQLKKLGFDTLTLNSPRCCGRTIKKVGKKAVTKVLIELAENEGSVRRVLLGNSKAYPNLAQFAEKLESLDESRLAAVLKRLSFLAQSKAYLFWQNPTSKAILGTS